jgi:phosphoglycolate phosphatase
MLKTLNVMFDLDGTLTDSRPGILRTIRHALRLVGLEPPYEEDLLWCVGPPLQDVFARLLPNGDPAIIEQAVSAYVERYDLVGHRENRIYDGVPAMLERLGVSRQLSVVTAKRQQIAENILEFLDLRSNFKVVFGSERSGRFGDKSELVHHVIETLGIKRSETVIVGDRIHDIDAGRNNGLLTVGASWGYGTPQELSGAHHLCQTPLQLVSLFE